MSTFASACLRAFGSISHTLLTTGLISVQYNVPYNTSRVARCILPDVENGVWAHETIIRVLQHKMTAVTGGSAGFFSETVRQLARALAQIDDPPWDKVNVCSIDRIISNIFLYVRHLFPSGRAAVASVPVPLQLWSIDSNM